MELYREVRCNTRACSGKPVLHAQVGDAVEVAEVGGDEGEVAGEGDRGDAQVGLGEPAAPIHSGSSCSESQWLGRTAAKWRWSKVRTSGVSRRSARAITEASTPPSGKSAYCSTSSAMRMKSSGEGGSTAKPARPCRKRASAFGPYLAPSNWVTSVITRAGMIRSRSAR